MSIVPLWFFVKLNLVVTVAGCPSFPHLVIQQTCGNAILSQAGAVVQICIEKMRVPRHAAQAVLDLFMKFRFFAYRLLVVIALAVLYFGASKLGLSLAFVQKNVSPVWPPTGIALAAVLLLGYRAWPGIALGAFVANYSTGLSLASASGIALGNTLEALTGAFLLRRFVGLRSPFDRAADVFKFVALACLLSTMVSATIGTTSLYLGSFIQGVSFPYLWWTWWLGDATGDLVVAPLILIWSAWPRPRWSSSRASDAVLLLVLIIIVGGIVLGPWFPTGFQRVYLTVPLILLATFRFKHRGATAAIFLLSAIAIGWTRYDAGPFVSENLNASLLSLQMFMGVTAVMALVLVAVIEERSQTEAALRESEERYRAVVEGAVEGILLADADSKRVLDANTAYLNLLGYTSEEILQLTLYDLVAHDRESIDRHSREVLATRHHFMDERRVRRKDGSLVDVEVSVNLISYGGRKVMCGIARDITERKLSEQALQESEERYRLLIENSPYCIHQINMEGQLLSMNKAGLLMMGLKDESEIINVSYLNAVTEEDQDRIGRLLQAALNGESSEFEFTAPSGRIFQSSFVPIRNNNGRVIRLMGLTQDITKRKQAEDQLKQAKAKYQSIFDNAIEGIFQTTPEGEFLTANPALVRLLGFASPEELIHERTDIARQSYVRPERREEFKQTDG